MHLLEEYIQPLISWLHLNPKWALLATFLISLSESLAIIGSIIPGSITMTAIGVLAGAGVIRIDLTLIAAALGAVAGDGASYALGYIFSDRLTNIWPFRSHPNLINYGKDYFTRHGAASILIGRFVGPIRSIIPVIAGMMGMNWWHFLLANVLSAILWAIVYVAPGILIGAASTELSTESAAQLFLLIILLLVTIWLVSMGLRWLFILTNQFLRIKLHHFWLWIQRKPTLFPYCKVITPKRETNHYPTAGLSVLWLSSFLISIVMIALVLQATWIVAFNNPIFLFLQSLRTQAFDTFFILIDLIISPLSLITLVITLALYMIYRQDWRTFRYWLSLACTSSLSVLLLSFLISTPIPHGLIHHQSPPSFPVINLTLATAIFVFFIFYSNKYSQTTVTLVLRILLLVILFLAGVAPVYLGDNWMTSVLASYFIGLTFGLFHWLFYRRDERTQPSSQWPLVLSCLAILSASCVYYSLYFKSLVRLHHPYLKQYVITDHVWWNQHQPVLPVYSTNRIGQRTGLFNIQYAGSLNTLQHALESYGWKSQPDSFFFTLLMRAGGQDSADKIPLMAQLYLNKRPTLIMTYRIEDEQTFLILNLWRSNYHLRHYHQPIWIGSVHRHLPKSTSLQPRIQPLVSTHFHVIHALQGFQLNHIQLPSTLVKPLPKSVSPELLIIKEPAGSDTTYSDACDEGE